MTAPMVDYKIHWLKMMSVPQSRAVVGRHDGINGRDNTLVGHIDLHDSDTAIALGKAMTRFENGVQPYSDDVWAGPQEPKSSGRY